MHFKRGKDTWNPMTIAVELTSVVRAQSAALQYAGSARSRGTVERYQASVQRATMDRRVSFALVEGVRRLNARRFGVR